jgi:glycosyltransferase involved in cell wall biosynthesis
MHLIIEGWRFYPHSYCLVNQHQCLQLLRRSDVTLYHRDLAPFRPHWKIARGLLDAASEQLLEQLPAPTPTETGAVTLRIAFPYDFRPSSSHRTFVYGTSEYDVPPGYLKDSTPLPQAMAASDAMIITPSEWSRQGFLRAGGDPQRIVVVPHGFDPDIYRPIDPQQKAALRSKFQIQQDAFIFLHVGAMTENKNLPLLLKAFAAVAQRHPQVRLGLKGLDDMYMSDRLLAQCGRGLSQAEASIIQPRIGYWGTVWPAAVMAELYQAADAYVCPYMAEAFNLPAMEAAACGLPIICTAGGPTDDFTTPQFALKIESRLDPSLRGPAARQLTPLLDSLINHMLAVVERSELLATAREAGPSFLTSHFTWKHAVDRLLQVLSAAHEKAPL